MSKSLILFSLFISLYYSAFSQTEDKVILITIDGMRWQEVFGGASDSMMQNKNITKDSLIISEKYHANTIEEARTKLMPFLWNTIAQKGQIYGNRSNGNNVNCTNRFWFSYPGYNEILTGTSDPEVSSNAKKYNKNKTVLEWLNEKKEYNGKVAAFCSWDVFPYIINDKRSGILVNAGFDISHDEPLSPTEKVLNIVQGQIPPEWNSVRFDAFTHHFAMEYMKKNHPKVVYISYGETDDFAHDGRYDHYLNSAYQTDQFIQEIYEYVQEDDFYKGSTTIMITTDHGRGSSPMLEWKSHGTIFKGSDEIWIAAIGHKIKAEGEIKLKGQSYQNQVAASVARALGLDYSIDNPDCGLPINSLFK